MQHETPSWGFPFFFSAPQPRAFGIVIQTGLAVVILGSLAAHYRIRGRSGSDRAFKHRLTGVPTS
jgi:hypothetical protein